MDGIPSIFCELESCSILDKIDIQILLPKSRIFQKMLKKNLAFGRLSQNCHIRTFREVRCSYAVMNISHKVNQVFRNSIFRHLNYGLSFHGNEVNCMTWTGNHWLCDMKGQFLIIPCQWQSAVCVLHITWLLCSTEKFIVMRGLCPVMDVGG